LTCSNCKSTGLPWVLFGSAKYFICRNCKQKYFNFFCPTCKTIIYARAFSYWQPSKGCFITTACCETLNLPDDCYELTAFRDFRDNWLRKQIDGEAIVQEYYQVAPMILDAIDTTNNPKTTYSNIWEKYLKTCLAHIESGEADKCKALYMSMVEDLKREYITS